MEVAKKLAEAFGVTLDFLVDKTGAVAEVTDREMLNRITEINHLDQTDKTVIIRVIDSLLRDAKAKKNIWGKEMQALIDDNKLKDLMKQAIIEAIEEKKDMVQELLLEALEDVAMIHAIKDGEDSGLAERDEIFGILSGSEGSA